MLRQTIPRFARDILVALSENFTRKYKIHKEDFYLEVVARLILQRISWVVSKFLGKISENYKFQIFTRINEFFVRFWEFSSKSEQSIKMLKILLQLGWVRRSQRGFVYDIVLWFLRFLSRRPPFSLLWDRLSSKDFHSKLLLISYDQLEYKFIEHELPMNKNSPSPLPQSKTEVLMKFIS